MGDEALERFRANEDAVPIDGRDFAWSAERSANPRQAAIAALEIRILLNKAAQDFGDRFSERFKQARLNSWSRLIDAKDAFRLSEGTVVTGRNHWRKPDGRHCRAAARSA